MWSCILCLLLLLLSVYAVLSCHKLSVSRISCPFVCGFECCGTYLSRFRHLHKEPTVEFYSVGLAAWSPPICNQRPTPPQPTASHTRLRLRRLDEWACRYICTSSSRLLSACVFFYIIYFCTWLQFNVMTTSGTLVSSRTMLDLSLSSCFSHCGEYTIN